jgi:PAS domain-containing protein
VCKAHTRVIPSESYTGQADADNRLRAITLLQQKAHSLEAEIQERKAIQKALTARERELTDFLENASEAIHQVSVDGRILWANKAELHLLGYSKEEYLGRHISEFHADADVIAEILERLGRGEELHDWEARLRHKDD